MRKFCLVIVLLFPLPSLAWCVFCTYDDCILENIKPGMSRAASYMVMNACKSKYPSKKAENPNPPSSKAGYFDDILPPDNSRPPSQQGGTYDDILNAPPKKCEEVGLTQDEINKIKLQPDGRNGYSIWNGNKFTVYGLAFKLKYNQIFYNGQPYGGNEVNKAIGYILGESDFSTNGKYDFPKGINEYQVIKATKSECKGEVNP